MGDVKKLGDSRPYYNLLACDGAGSNTANCQLFAAKIYKTLVGSELELMPWRVWSRRLWAPG